MNEDTPEDILVPDGNSTAEIEIKKSRFIAFCCYASNEKEAREIVTKLKEKHKFARHVVYAFICGKRNSQIMGMNDDGEPKGTAGRPLLQVLKGSGVTDILCAVIRYFGGIKLGTGGLVRAYTEAAQASLETLGKKTLVIESELTVRISYDNYDITRRIISSENRCLILSEEFLGDVIIKARIPDAIIETIKSRILNATSGKAEFTLKPY